MVKVPQLAAKPQMLNSWKEIAVFLDRGVRTVQRWERDLQLPVHRIGQGKRSPVYALVPEIRFWVATSNINGSELGAKRPVLVAPNREKARNSVIENSHRLMAQSLELVRSVAETSVLQQRQAELLKKRIMEMKSRLR